MKKQNTFFYFIKAGKFSISDIELTAKSKKTFDIKFHDLANNSELLDLFHLYYIPGGHGVYYDYKSRAKWFCGYISYFTQSPEMREKAMTNPIVRINAIDENLYNKILLLKL